jgi:hypothetical protein
MASLTKIWDEAEMYRTLEPLLLPGESLEAAVYCSYQDTGFFASRYPTAGFLGLTDGGRLIGVKVGLLGESEISADLSTVTKLRLRQNIFQKLGNQTEVWLEYFSGQGNGKLRFTLLPKIYGGKLPHQAENVQRILAELNLLSGGMK